jgi:hypothetical protein
MQMFACRLSESLCFYTFVHICHAYFGMYLYTSLQNAFLNIFMHISCAMYCSSTHSGDSGDGRLATSWPAGPAWGPALAGPPTPQRASTGPPPAGGRLATTHLRKLNRNRTDLIAQLASYGMSSARAACRCCTMQIQIWPDSEKIPSERCGGEARRDILKRRQGM